MSTKKKATFQNGDEVLSHFIPSYEREHLIPYGTISESGLSAKSGASLGREIAKEFQGLGPNVEKITEEGV